MKTMKDALKEMVVLHGYEGMDVLTLIDEDPDDIWMLIYFTDHGDEFVLIGTRDDKKCLYGLFENRKYNYGEYIRNPQLFKSIDNHKCAKVSNDIFRMLESAFKKSHMSFGYDKQYFDKGTAQFYFHKVLRYISEKTESANAVFDYNDKKRDIALWLSLNEIDTPENICKLQETQFDNKIKFYENKIVGIAGKKDAIDYNRIWCDNVINICINGKYVDPNKLTYSHSDQDEWGVESIGLSLNSFQKSKKYEG